MILSYAQHENILFQILKEIYSDTAISPFLGFKGGTAAYLFYGLNRFSTDLDFDILDESKEEIIFEKVVNIAKRYGDVKEARKKRYSVFVMLSYADHSHNIKIEMNRRHFGSHYEIKTALGISMLVMVREDMFAHKLVALYERFGKTNRDIYDVWFFLKNNWPINQQIVENRTQMSFKKCVQRCVAALEKMSDRNILSGIGELLGQDQKSWVKKHLREEVLFLLRLKIRH